VYTENPRSVERPFSLSIDKCRFPELALPFLIAEQGSCHLIEIKIAGTMKANINTQYCATWVYVIPFIPLKWHKTKRLSFL
jgi:hypothetical protein